MGGRRASIARRASAALVLVAATSGLGASLPPAAAQDAPGDLALPPADPPPHPVLDSVPVVPTRATRAADAALDEVTDRRDAAAGAWLLAESARRNAQADTDLAGASLAQAQERVEEAEATLAEEERTLAELEADEDERKTELAAEQGELRTMAAAIYTTMPADRGVLLGTWEQINTGEQRAALRRRVVEIQVSRVDRRTKVWLEARDRADGQRARRDEAASALSERRAELDAAILERTQRREVQAAREAAVRERQGQLDRLQVQRTEALEGRRQARLGTEVEGLDVSLVAINAYWEASRQAPCSVPWWVIAGVGRVESGHGTAQGSRVTPEGDTTVAIVGIPLDGRPGTAVIADSDDGRLDRDATWDRAVGPMQFLPGTWRTMGTDGDKDGTTDPNNLNDAAAAAGRLLCFRRGDLLTEAAQRAALLGYNNSTPYGTKVLDWGRRYRAALDLPDIPPEETEGAEGAGTEAGGN